MLKMSRGCGRAGVVVRAAAVVAAGWLATTAGLRSAGADVLEQTPSDALVVFKINHLDAVNTKVADLLTQLGVVDLQPDLKDPLKFLKDQSGMGDGIDTKRDAAVVLMNGKFEEDEGPTVALIPVSDFKKFIGTTTLVRTDGDVSVVHFKDQSKDMYAQQWGDYAAIADRKELLASKHDGLKPAGTAAKEMETRDFCLYVNFPALKAVLMPKLQEGKSKAADEIANQAKDDGQKKLATAGLDQAFNVLDRFLTDARATTIGLSIGKAGVTTNMTVEFEPGSYLAKMAAAFKTTDGPLLAGLPEQNYLAFGGSVQDPAAIAQYVNDVIGPVVKELPGLGENGTKLQALVETYKDAMLTTESTAAGMIVPTAAFRQGPLVRYLSIQKADANKLKDAAIKAAQMQNDVMASFGVKEMAMLKVTVTPAERTVNGVKFDKVLTEVDPNNNTPAAQGAAMQMSIVYGPDGAATLIGVVDPKTVLAAVGVDDTTLAGAIDAIKANKDNLTDTVKAIDAELPKARSAAFYFDVGQFLATGVSYAKAFGAPVPFQIPPNLPPIGTTAGGQGSALRFDSFVPMQLMQSVAQVGMQAYMQFQNRGGI